MSSGFVPSEIRVEIWRIECVGSRGLRLFFGLCGESWEEVVVGGFGGFCCRFEEGRED